MFAVVSVHLFRGGGGECLIAGYTENIFHDIVTANTYLGSEKLHNNEVNSYSSVT